MRLVSPRVLPRVVPVCSSDPAGSAAQNLSTDTPWLVQEPSAWYVTASSSGCSPGNGATGYRQCYKAACWLWWWWAKVHRYVVESACYRWIHRSTQRSGKLQAQKHQSGLQLPSHEWVPNAEIPTQCQTHTCQVCRLAGSGRAPTFHIRAHAHSCGSIRVQLSRPVSCEQRMLGAEAPGQSIHRISEGQHEGIALSGDFVARMPAHP